MSHRKSSPTGHPWKWDHWHSKAKSVYHFVITAEIHAHSLANFYCQYADKHMKIHAMRQRARAGNSTICYRKKQIDVSF